ncbi:MAG: 4Fe-4S dicluster domain-containing protein [Candidatus Hydrogenedentes bacterium]|nr:4Fe-4S dicluster domain-containing protein [Candidatus Hydrogenedentota bacterium]
MELNRRGFLHLLGAGATCMCAGPALGESNDPTEDDGMAMLVDTTECIGCRKCEFACDQAQGLSGRSRESFEDTSVFDQPRRMVADAYTVVNRYPQPNTPDQPIYVKSQCMHCVKPACVSACLVGALTTAENGAVVYDAGKCMGCRYCMVACPFEVPAYEYSDPLTPRVRKCVFCFERVKNEAKIPACAEMCPPMCLTYGKRTELLALAHERIAKYPDKYVNNVYGEHEVGGTRWLYLAAKPFEELGFLTLGDKPIPQLTETLQHSIFKFGIPPLLLFGVLGAAITAFKDDSSHGAASAKDASSSKPKGVS